MLGDIRGLDALGRMDGIYECICTSAACGWLGGKIDQINETNIVWCMSATEVYQTTDRSTDFRDTEEFLDRRLEDLRVAGSAVNNTMEWIGFQGGAIVNLLRSKGVRI